MCCLGPIGFINMGLQARASVFIQLSLVPSQDLLVGFKACEQKRVRLSLGSLPCKK